MTSDFGGNLDEIEFEFLNKKKTDQYQEKGQIGTNNETPRKLLKISEVITEQVENKTAKTKIKEDFSGELPKLKTEKGKSEKNVSFKEVKQPDSAKNDDFIKLKKQPALLKTTSIMNYNYPTLLNEEA